MDDETVAMQGKPSFWDVLRFLIEPLDCGNGSLAQQLLSETMGSEGWKPVPWGHVLEGAWRLSCELRIPPAIQLMIIAILLVGLVLFLYNKLVTWVRWYAASRGSAFVGVATAALRELHASGAFFPAPQPASPPLTPTAAPRAATPASPSSPFSSTAGTSAKSHTPNTIEEHRDAAAGDVCGDSAGAPPASSTSGAVGPTAGPPRVRPAAVHRWFTPQAVTAPVVCCACFQPVVVAQGVEGRAQCCELCAMVAHGSCVKAVPHNCRLLALPPPPELPAAAASADTAGQAAGSAPAHGGPLPPPLPLPHDWRPAGTTLDLILPPADAEMLLGGERPDDGPGGAAPGAAPTHGPSSLCLYCDEPCEVGLLAVEPVWRCGGCRRFTHVRCWAVRHPGVLSTATLAALEGQTLDVEEMPATPRGSTTGPWQPQSPRPLLPPPAAANGGNNGHAGCAAPADSSTRAGRGKSGGGSGGSNGGGSGGGSGSRHSSEIARTRTSAAARGQQPATGATGPAAAGQGPPKALAYGAGRSASQGWGWGDQHRRSQSLPNMAAAGPMARGRTNGGGTTATGEGSSGGGGERSGRGGRAGASDGGAPAGSEVGTNITDRYGGHAASTLAVSLWREDPARLALLDRCDPQASLGPLGVLMLPPTAVRLALLHTSLHSAWLGGGSSSTTTVTLRPSTSRASKGGAAATTSASSTTPPAVAAGSVGATTAPPATATSGSRGRKKQRLADRALRQATQWYRAHTGWSLTAPGPPDPSAPDRWRHFALGALPPGCRPLLVFINPRSGPQAGEHLRRQLLQLLHPLQVVDLDRETPVAALRFWWGVSGLRVAVVGGDGSAGWVLGEIDRVAAERAAELAEMESAQADGGEEEQEAVQPRAVPPPPPPVAVLPMGTGNDLARVLGWGGGLAAIEARGGVAAALAEVAAAAPTPLDRWALAIAPTQQEPARRGRGFLSRRRQSAAAAFRSQPPPVQVKVFNNYLGVGIDSWCALEFHRMRERYPGWFRSQLGNKMWYTGVGARDLLARSCVDLPSRLQLLCDGCPIELPPATQGLLLLNIPSYMGGVDLWGNGVTLGQQQQYMTPSSTEVPSPDRASRMAATAGPLPSNSAAPRTPDGPMLSVTNIPPVSTTAVAAATATAAAALGGPLTTSLSLPAAALLPHPSTAQQPLAVPQSMSDGVMEVVAVYGAVHLGQLQVGLARATRLCQCRTVVITTRQALPMQVDGEPWMQPPAQLSISLKGGATMLRRLDLTSATARLVAAVGEVLDAAVARGSLSAAQRQALGAELAARLGAPHTV